MLGASLRVNRDLILENPFEVVGLNREVLRGLKPEEALRLAEALFKRVSEELDPKKLKSGPRNPADRLEVAEWARFVARRTERYQLLQECMEALRQPGAAARFLTDYKPVTPDRLVQQAREKKEATLERTAQLQERVLRLLSAKALKPPGTVFNPGPCRILLFDYSSALSASFIGNENDHRELPIINKPDPTGRDYGRLGLFLRELRVGADGRVLQETGGVPGMPKQLAAVVAIEPDKQGQETLASVFRRIGLKVPSAQFLLPGPEQPISADPPLYRTRLIDDGDFGMLAHYWQPELGISSPQKHLFLFSATTNQETGKAFFSLEGLIETIEPENVSIAEAPAGPPAAGAKRRRTKGSSSTKKRG